jgi:hypothetical protein
LENENINIPIQELCHLTQASFFKIIYNENKVTNSLAKEAFLHADMFISLVFWIALMELILLSDYCSRHLKVHMTLVPSSYQLLAIEMN